MSAVAVVGTVPDPEFSLVHGRVSLDSGYIRIQDRRIPVRRCTPALIAAAIRVSECVRCPEIYAFLAGEIGRGEGSRALYRYLYKHIAEYDFQVMTFHYLLPHAGWHRKIMEAVKTMRRQPVLIADAGFMYAAKMSGQSGYYEFFTPDVGELAFLADELAPHPFYTRGFIIHQESNVDGLIHQAYLHNNAAEYLLVKGQPDHIVHEGRVIETVDSPALEGMEAVGGTGDSLTGLLTVLRGAGYEPAEAAILAAKANRLAGYYAECNPAMQVHELIEKIPQALSELINSGHFADIQEK